MPPPSPPSGTPSEPTAPPGGASAPEQGTAAGAGSPAPRKRPAAAAGAAQSLTLRLRRAHAAIAPWVLAPLLLTVCTGMAYRLLRDWGGLGRDQAHGLMVLHEGEWLRRWLGAGGETLYVLLNGLGLLWMLASGGAMLVQRLRRRAAPESRERDT